MLYDTPARATRRASLAGDGDAEVRRVTEDTLGWLAREMTSPDGGFYSSLDADSEGHEASTIWDSGELDALLARMRRW